MIKLDLPHSESTEQRIGNLVEAFIEKLNQGETPDIDEYVRENPELADLLRGTLGALQTVRSIDMYQSGRIHGDEDHANGAALGDFQILREIGRGGMGVVYEAKQISLARNVALKVLPSAAMLDSKNLQRFKNEAQAAATLHHPNIVPVYSVGCDRGVHYYAMQLIDGQTLAQVVQELKVSEEKENSSVENIAVEVASETARSLIAGTTTKRSSSTNLFRSVAKLFAPVAGALHYAHQHGVVHRDIKPSNLILDPHGCLWVADFGLAQVENENQLTMTGDILGTLRYMSPEQALAKRTVLDHRTDIYSLGITLYELLALRPAFDAEDRQGLLKQIAFEEAPPLRKLAPGIPKELETIVNKAISKDPDERYQSAQELAEDLQLYLDDKPILAKPPSVAQRVSKWSKRHTGILTAAITALSIVCVILSVAVVMILASEKKAVQHQATMEEDFRLAHSTLNEFLEYFRDNNIENTASLALRQRSLMQAALTYYNNFLGRKTGNDSFLHELAQGYFRLGLIEAGFSSDAKALAAFKQSRRLYLRLLARYPESEEYRIEAADDIRRVACFSGAFFQPEAAERYQLEALTLVKMGYSEKSTVDYCSEYAHCLRDYAGREVDVDLRHKMIEQGVELLKNMPTTRPDLRLELGIAYKGLAGVRRSQGKSYDAERLLLLSLDMCEEASNAAIPARNSNQDVAYVHISLGSFYTSRSDYPRARSHLEIALNILTNELRQIPENNYISGGLSNLHTAFGQLAQAQNQQMAADDHFLKARQFTVNMSEMDPDNPHHSYDVAMMTIQEAQKCSESNQIQDALILMRSGATELERAIELMQVNNAEQKPIDNAINHLTDAYIELADLYEQEGDGHKAKLALKKALRLRNDLARRHPKNVTYQKSLIKLKERMVADPRPGSDL